MNWSRSPTLTEFAAMVLLAVGYFQPVARGGLSNVFGKEVSRDTMAVAGCRFYFLGTAQPDARRALPQVTAPHLLSIFDMETLRDLLNVGDLKDAGRLSRRAAKRDPLRPSKRATTGKFHKEL